MKRPFTTLVMTIIVAGMALAIPINVAGQTSPPPFNAPGRSVKMSCAYCHKLHRAGTFVTTGTAAVEALCMSCHNGTYTDPVTLKTAVLVATHVDPRTNYGAWKVSCLGCHSAHRHAKASGSEAVNPPNGYGNWKMIGDWVREASSTDGLARIRRPVIVDTLNNNAGSERNYGDDVMEGYYCSNTADIATAANSGAVRSGGVVTIKTIASHRFSVNNSVWVGGVAAGSFNGGPFVIATTPTSKTFTFSQAGINVTSGGGTTTTRIVNVAGCNADPPSATDLTRKVVFYDNRYPGSASLNQWAQSFMTAPSTVGSKWYDGACNVCHTRTSHNRRDNSGGDRHNTDKACSNCHKHDAGWIR